MYCTLSRMGRYNESKSEVRFFIRDIKNFRFVACSIIEIYRFAIFRKNSNFPGFYNFSFFFICCIYFYFYSYFGTNPTYIFCSLFLLLVLIVLQFMTRTKVKLTLVDLLE